MKNLARFAALLLLGTCALGGRVMAAEPTNYPHGDLLAETAELAGTETGPKLVILDVRGEEPFRAGHVARAVRVDPAEWSKAFDNGQDAAGWGRRIAALGIGPESKIVLYDDSSFKDAARAWWILKYWGARDVRLLNGGWPAWQAAGLPTKSGAGHKPATGSFAVKPQSDRLATKQLLLDALARGSGDLQIVDARSEKEFCGLEKMKNKRAGAIPGARHLDWSDLVDKSSRRFKSAGELRELFSAAGISLDRPAAAHCQSGGRASVMVFALELMGAERPRNYYRSWAEWGNADDTPIVPGETQKK